jgi:hypothetical protein
LLEDETPNLLLLRTCREHSAQSSVSGIDPPQSNTLGAMDMRAFSEQLFKVDPKSVDLKFIFDHFRNYLICGALVFGSKALEKSEGFVSFPYFNTAASWLLLITGFLLFSLNFAHGLFALKAVTKSRINDWIYVLCSVLLFMTLTQVLGVRIGA